MISYEEACVYVESAPSIICWDLENVSPKQFQDMFNFGNKISPHYERLRKDISCYGMVTLYRDVSNRAKKAATQTTLCFRRSGFPRDIARLVGRTVYETRLEDAFAWLKTDQKKSKRQKRF